MKSFIVCFLLVFTLGIAGAQALPTGADPNLHWTAEWIGLDENPVASGSATAAAPVKTRKVFLPVTQLRADFQLDGAPARAILYVTALGHIEPRLNGARVSDECFTPGWTDYHKRLYYRAYDVTDRLRPGANTLAALLAD